MTTDGPRGLARGLTNYGDADFALYLRRSFARSMGYSAAALARPIVGIADSGSGFNNCHRHFPELVEAVKRGVLAAGGLPIEFPTVSLGEVPRRPAHQGRDRWHREQPGHDGRHLRSHGHREHDGLPGRDARHGAAGDGRHSRRPR